jgi:hypothetical protein
MEETVLELPQLVQAPTSSVKMTDIVLGTLDAHARSQGGTHWGFSETNKMNKDTALLIYATNEAKTARFAKYIISKELSKEYYAGTTTLAQLISLDVRLAHNEAGEELFFICKPSELIGFAMDKVKAEPYKPKTTLSDDEALKWANAAV